MAPSLSTALLLASLPGLLAAGSATLFSSDLMGKKSLDNVKATWDESVDIFGSPAKLSLL